jgi:SHS2 domain-containing protein
VSLDERVGLGAGEDAGRRAEGVFDSIVANRDEARIAAREPVSLQARATDELLVTWLAELIFRCETRHRLYARFDVHLADDGLSLQAEIGGESIDRDRHLLDHEVRAVTRHVLCLRREGEGWLAELIWDIGRVRNQRGFDTSLTESVRRDLAGRDSMCYNLGINRNRLVVLILLLPFPMIRESG